MVLSAYKPSLSANCFNRKIILCMCRGMQSLCGDVRDATAVELATKTVLLKQTACL